MLVKHVKRQATLVYTCRKVSETKSEDSVSEACEEAGEAKPDVGRLP